MVNINNFRGNLRRRQVSYQRFWKVVMLPSQLLFFLSPLTARAVVTASSRSEVLQTRAVEDRCGPNVGSCPSGQCCSAAGYCGTTADFCSGPDCQLEYSGLSCDTSKRPSGPSTENLPRPDLGTVPYGEDILRCTIPGTMALTFDDGPWNYTMELLDLLAKRGVKATFFVSGNNLGKGMIDDPATPWPALLRRMYADGHHIASHTWTHRDLNEVNETIRQTEMVYNEMAFRNLLGWIPTYMRPPYAYCYWKTGCVTTMRALGYHIVELDVDTKDYMYDSPEQIQFAKDRYNQSVANVNATGPFGHITLAHDVHLQSVINLTNYMIDTARQRGYRLTTVGECLGDPPQNWYRLASGNSTNTKSSTSTGPTPISSPRSTNINPSTVATSISTPVLPTPAPLYRNISSDQTCGGLVKGYTCRDSAYGNCCSYWGFCGSGAQYCGTGCQNNYGICDTSNPAAGIGNTTNGLCGSQFNATCASYGVKTCCSASGYCGNTNDHCLISKGCQSGFSASVACY